MKRMIQQLFEFRVHSSVDITFFFSTELFLIVSWSHSIIILWREYEFEDAFSQMEDDVMDHLTQIDLMMYH